MELKIEYLPITELKPYENNARKHAEADIEAIKKSIEEFGFNDPIGIWHDTIVEGHGRLLAAQELEMAEVPVIRLDHMTDEERRAYALAHNKTAELSEWDFEMLDTELDDIFDIDMSQFGFDISADDDPIEIIEDEVPETAPSMVKLGDVWQLGKHRLICGDSTDVNVIDGLMNGVNADMVFTDPPYNVAFNGRSGKFDVIENDDIGEDEFKDLITASCNIIRMLDPKAYYIWCNWKFYGILQEQLDYKSCIVWAKNVFGLGKGYRHQHEFCLFNGNIDEEINNESDLWEIAKDTNYVHPTQKPVGLCARALKNHKGAEAIVDLFGGSGSTLIACEQLDRKCYMAELDPKYCDVIIQRYINFKGSAEDVFLIRDGEKIPYEEVE